MPDKGTKPKDLKKDSSTRLSASLGMTERGNDNSKGSKVSKRAPDDDQVTEKSSLEKGAVDIDGNTVQKVQKV